MPLPETTPWPDVMDGKTAARYCRVTTWAINKAWRDTKLASAGKRGGNGARTYDKTALDRWMRGQEP